MSEPYMLTVYAPGSNMPPGRYYHEHDVNALRCTIAQQAQELERHVSVLAAMTAERDEWKRRALLLSDDPDYQQCCALRNMYKEQLAEARARLDTCGHWTPEHASKEWRADRQRTDSTKQAEADAQLQVTLTEQEETIRQLSVANQYFAISEEALAKQRDAAVQEAARLRARLAVLEEEA